MKTRFFCSIACFGILCCTCLFHCRAVEAGPAECCACRDSLAMDPAVRDSLIQVIAGASVKRISTVGYDADTTAWASRKKALSAADKERFQFLLLDKSNFQSDVTVFGRFMPSVRVTMKSGGRKLLVSLDFGLSKWSLTDLKSGEEWRFDLRSEELLRWAWLQFPDDLLLKTLYLSQA